jgi:outer membrane murein-binding lipoprotein Lpp
MPRVLLASMMLLAPLVSFAADDLKVIQLEQDVRDLQRQVRAQAQQIEQLRMQQKAPGQPATSSKGGTAAAPGAGEWVDASKWKRLKTGMNELDVIGLLGPPTSMREKDGERVLLYAMEIGSAGFLSGSVTLRDRVVLAIQPPVLR